MHLFSIFAIFASLSLLLVHGRPQISIGGSGGIFGGGPVALSPASNQNKNNNPSTIDFGPAPSSSSELTGIIKFQLFLPRSKNDRNLVKVTESNATFTIPAVSSSIKSKCQNPDELFHEPSGKCYLRGEPVPGIESPCFDDLMEFSESYEKPGQGIGECYCVRSKGSQARPVVLWGKSNRCYWLYDQGPCNKGEWLLYSNVTDPDGYKDVVCTKRTCPENVFDPLNSFQKFWFPHKGKCYEYGSPNVELCGNNKDLNVYLSEGEPGPICSERRPQALNVKHFAGPAGDLECHAGHKKTANGSCKRIARFERKK